MAVKELNVKDDRIAFFWVLVLVVISGNPVFNNSEAVRYVLPFVTLISVAATVLHWNIDFLLRLLFGCTVFIFVFLIQYFEFGLFEPAYVSMLLKIIFGAVVANKVGDRFVRALVEVMYCISLMSLLFYVLQLIVGPENFPNLVETFAPGGNQKSVLIHTVVVNDALRNSSLFWEPGAFQGFIIVALGLATMQSLLMSREGRLRLVVFCIALATTQSTTGVVVFFLLATTEVLAGKGVVELKIGLLIFMLAAGFGAFFGLDFVGEKISIQLDQAKDLSEYYGDRFRGFLLDFSYVSERPLTGNGFAEELRWRLHPDLMGRNLGHGNGFSGFLVNTGLTGLSVFVVGILTAGAPFSTIGRRLFFLVVLLALLQAEQFLNFSFFWALCFLTVSVKDTSVMYVPPKNASR